MGVKSTLVDKINLKEFVVLAIDSLMSCRCADGSQQPCVSSIEGGNRGTETHTVA